MKNHIIIAALSLIVIIFITSCGSNRSENKKEITTTEQSENAKYQCPMKCEGEKMYDKPGSCPVCNMDLEEVEENHEHHDHDTTHQH